MPKRSVTLSGFRRPQFDLVLKSARLCLGVETKVMGILNVTPDSFSDGGRFDDPGRAEARAYEIEREGAHILDIGAESTRPGARPVSAREEIRRLKPVFSRLSKKIKIPLSIDTMKDDVARFALDEGAKIVNDVSALRAGGKELAKRVARSRAGLVLMHMRGTPLTMQKNTRSRDLFGQMRRELEQAVNLALEAGVSRSSVLIDPGFGFGKSPEQNWQLLAGLHRFAALGFPVLVGISRKSFIGHVTGAPVNERLFGSLAAAALAVERGAHIVRAHDVAAHVQMARTVDRVTQQRA